MKIKNSVMKVIQNPAKTKIQILTPKIVVDMLVIVDGFKDDNGS